jgi:acyl carrier protein
MRATIDSKRKDAIMNQELLEQLAGFAKIAYQYDGEITADTTFDELGAGSMKMIALTSTIENELDAEVTIHEIMKMKTFGELVERVAEEMED